jgi:small multidrug resistance family-3 protein
LRRTGGVSCRLDEPATLADAACCGVAAPSLKPAPEPLAMSLLATAGLFVLTAVMELVGCYLPWLWLKGKAGAWVLLPAAAALVAFVWLLTLHPTASGRVYAAYGGVYVATAVLWLWVVDGLRPTAWDLAGSAVALLGMAIIVVGSRTPS